MKIKILTILIAPTLLIGCFDPYNKVEQIEQVSDLEKKLAQIDGHDDATPYFKVLDAIQGKCYEQNRTALAAMARSIAKIEEEEIEQKLSHLDSLKLLYSEAITYTDDSNSKKINCLDIITMWKKNQKEMAKEEAEIKEQEEIMELGN
jgi:RIO-like serine/threonine protein kinase